MLEDILLMINIFVLKNETLCNEFNKLLENKKLNNIELLEEIGKEKLKKLYKLNKDLLEKNSGFKIIISAFDDSIIEKQLQKLKEYNMEVEICKSSYNMYFSVWENSIKIIGKL